MSEPERGRSATSLPGSRQILTRREVRPDLLKPILNMGRFFVGDTIPRLPDPREINARLKDVKTRKLPVTPAADALLTKTLLLLLRPLEAADRDALGLLAGLVLLVVEDDYFYIPETTEQVGDERLLELARGLARVREREVQRLERVVAAHRLSLVGAAEVGHLGARLPRSAELERVLARLEIHLRQGEEILRRHSDLARRSAHAARFADACTRAVNLIGRLLMVPQEQDHARLRKRIVSRELRLIEIDALGAAAVSDKEQAAEAARLLAQTGVSESDVPAGLGAAEIAARLAEIGAAEAGPEPEDEEQGDWFFDME